MRPRFEKKSLRVLAECSDANAVPKAVRAIAFSPDSRHVAWFTDHKELWITDWNPTTNALQSISKVKALAVREEDTIHSLVFGRAAHAIVRKPSLGKQKLRPSFIRFDKDDLLLVAGTKSGRIKIWSVNTGKMYFELSDHKSQVADLAFNPVNHNILLSCSHDGLMKLWDLSDDGNMYKTLKNQPGPCLPIMTSAWSPCSTLIASGGSDRIVTIWDSVTYSKKFSLVGHMHSVVKVRFFPDSNLLASASWDSSVKLWNPWLGTALKTLWHMLPAPSPIVAFGENRHEISDLTISVDGQHLATACADGKLRVWHKDEEGPVDQLTLNGVCVCAYSGDGRSLAIASTMGVQQIVASPMKVSSLMHLTLQKVAKVFPHLVIPQLPLPLRIINNMLLAPHVDFGVNSFV